MHQAVTNYNLGPPTWVAIALALVAAISAIIAAVIAARSARSAKKLEIQAQRIRDLESRISARKYQMYEPFLDMIGNFFDHTERGRAAIANPEANVEGFVSFAKWVTTYGSDEAVEAYHKFNLATSNKAPHPILTRLMADFLIAVRKDLSYPDTKISRATLIATSFRVGDFYQQGDFYRKIMSLPLHEACKLAGWREPWKFSEPTTQIHPPDSDKGGPPTDPAAPPSG